jgi:DNA-binding LytR/AlgR family response regulator
LDNAAGFVFAAGYAATFRGVFLDPVVFMRERMGNTRKPRIARRPISARSSTGAQPARYLRHIPVRSDDAIVILPVDGIASLVCERELLHLTTHRGERHTIVHRLIDLEARLDPARFLRLSRSAIVDIDAIERVSHAPNHTYCVTLRNLQVIGVSRARARVLRERLLTL